MQTTTRTANHERSVVETAARHQQRLKNILRLSFSIAGMLWIVSYVFPFSTQELRTEFRLHQYHLYMVLLTLWGFQAKRELKISRTVSELAELHGVHSTDVSDAMIVSAGKQTDFALLMRPTSPKSWLVVAFVWILLASTYALIALQLISIFR